MSIIIMTREVIKMRIRRIAVVVGIALLLGCCTFPARAANVQVERIDFDDGSYTIIETFSDVIRRSNIGDSKRATHYDSNGDRCFSYTLYATFSYDGKSSRAETVDYEVDIYQRGWDISSHREWTSGDTAYGRASFTAPDGDSHPVSLSLTCDEDGNVS